MSTSEDQIVEQWAGMKMAWAVREAKIVVMDEMRKYRNETKKAVAELK